MDRYTLTLPAPTDTGPTNRPAITVPGNPGFFQLKWNSSPGLPPLNVTDFAAPSAPLAKTFMPWGTRMLISRGNPVGIVPGGGNPAGGVKRVSDGLRNGGQLEAFKRASSAPV